MGPRLSGCVVQDAAERALECCVGIDVARVSNVLRDGWVVVALEESADEGRYLAGSVGLARTGRFRFLSPPGPIMIGAAGIGLIGSGVFNTDPVSGYPPGTPPQQIPPTHTGALHNLCAIPIFVGIPGTALLSAGAAMRAGETTWAVYSCATAAVMVGTAALFGQAFAQKPSLVASGGLLQRISITSGFAWLTALHTAAANTLSR